MAFRLRAGLHYCACAGRIVFLDLPADRYFCLPPAVERRFRRLADGEALSSGDEEVRDLWTQGLLVPDPRAAGIGPPASIDAPARDFLELGMPNPLRFADVAHALAADAGMTLMLHRRSLTDIVRRLEGQRLRRGPERVRAGERLRQIAAAFAAGTAFVRAADRCLVRSLALQSVCVRERIRTLFVIGVRVNPFAAHCWVQREDAVLIGDFEQARLFTPILVVG